MKKIATASDEHSTPYVAGKIYDGHPVHEEVLSEVKEGEVYILNRHAQIVEESQIVLKATLRADPDRGSGMEIAIKPAL